MRKYELARILTSDKTRVSGNGSFKAPSPDDIGRIVVVTRPCITWDGSLGYFEDDPSKEKFAFWNKELEMI